MALEEGVRHNSPRALKGAYDKWGERESIPTRRPSHPSSSDILYRQKGEQHSRRIPLHHALSGLGRTYYKRGKRNGENTHDRPSHLGSDILYRQTAITHIVHHGACQCLIPPAASCTDRSPLHISNTTASVTVSAHPSTPLPILAPTPTQPQPQLSSSDLAPTLRESQ